MTCDVVEPVQAALPAIDQHVQNIPVFISGCRGASRNRHTRDLHLIRPQFVLSVADDGLLCGHAWQIMREGKDLTLVAFGKLVGYNLKAAEILAKEGIDCEVPPFD